MTLNGLTAATLALVGLGCATSLSTFQPAHVAPKGHAQAEAGIDVSVPLGTIVRVVDAGKSLVKTAKDGTNLTEAQQRQLLEAGVNLALNPPASNVHAGLAYTPIERLELRLRYMSGAWRAGVRWQVLRQAEDGADLTVGLGLQRFAYEYPVDKVLDVVALEDFTRWTLDAPMLVGRHGDFYRLWAGPRLLASSFRTALRLDLSSVGGPMPSLAQATGQTLFAGGVGGVALGWKHLFLAFELTVVRLFGSADLEAFGQRTNVDLGGWIVYPGLGLLGEF
jgi:hypothetical protein